MDDDRIDCELGQLRRAGKARRLTRANSGEICRAFAVENVRGVTKGNKRLGLSCVGVGDNGYSAETSKMEGENDKVGNDVCDNHAFDKRSISDDNIEGIDDNDIEEIWDVVLEDLERAERCRLGDMVDGESNKATEANRLSRQTR